MPEFNINGSIAADAPVDAAAFGTLRVSLRRELPVPVPPPSYSLPRPDGRFTASAAPGDYRVSLAPFLGLPPVFPSGVVRVPKGLENAYVKSVRLGGVDALNNGVHFDGSPASPLEIVLGMHPGSVEGAVRHDAPSGAAGLTVTLLPNLRSRFDLIRTGATDAAGLFRIDRVPPGEYRVFAWDEVNDGDWNDPDFIRAYEDRGVPVHVGDDGAATRVQLAAIPVQR